MSLSGIFDPIVRTWARNHFALESSGGDDSGVTVIDFPMAADEAINKYPSYDMSDSLGAQILRVSDKIPTIAELDGSTMFCALERNALMYRIRISVNDGTLILDSETDLLVASVPERYIPLCFVFSETTSAILAEMGIDVPPGLYFATDVLQGTSGACLIYGLPKGA